MRQLLVLSVISTLFLGTTAHAGIEECSKFREGSNLRSKCIAMHADHKVGGHEKVQKMKKERQAEVHKALKDRSEAVRKDPKSHGGWIPPEYN